MTTPSKKLSKLIDRLRDYAISIKEKSADEKCYYHAAAAFTGNRFLPGTMRTNETRSTFTMGGFKSHLPSVHAEMSCLQQCFLRYGGQETS